MFIPIRQQLASHVGLAVARLGAQGARLRRHARDPAGLVGRQGLRQQPRMVVALHHVQGVVGDILARHIPGVAAAIGVLVGLHAADADALALAQGVKTQAHVFAHGLAVGRLHGARLVRQVAVQEFAERALANKTDARRILLLRIRQGQLFGDLAHLRFRDFTERKQGLGQLRLVQAVQEVALVLAGVDGLEQLEAARVRRRLAHARIVARGDQVGAQGHGVVEESLELDFGVAQHVRVRRAAGLVFAQEIGEDAVLVFGSEIDGLDIDADDVGHAGRIDPVLARGAVFRIVVIFPVFHEQADDFIALFLQHPCRDRGIDPARHADNDFLLAHLAFQLLLDNIAMRY